jgi:hypothetical protein
VSDRNRVRSAEAALLRIGAVALATLALIGLSASSATAKTRTIDVPAKVLTADAYEGETLCTYAAFLQWPDRGYKAVRWVAHWERLGVPVSEEVQPPFNDTVVFDSPYVAGAREFNSLPGFHWIMLDYGGGEGPPGTVDCGTAAAVLAQVYTGGHVEVTVEEDVPSLQCKKAKAAATAAKRRLRGARKSGNRKAVRRAKKSLRQARKRVRKHC